jgi:hypothetical protein
MRSITREMALKLFQSSEPIDLYVFHREYGVEPADVLLAAKFFSKLGVATTDGPMLVPTPNARTWLHHHRAKFFKDHRRPWAKADSRQLRAFEPYLPDLGKIERDFFLGLVDPAGPTE